MTGITDISTRLPTKPQKELFNQSFILDQTSLNKIGYQVIRNYGTNVEQFELDFDQASSGQLYFSQRVGAITHQYKVELSSSNLSEDPTPGGFHTDFWVQKFPPPYIAALCLKTDPRYPHYGRTQIAHVTQFIQRMEEAFGISENDLLTHKLNYQLAETIYQYPMLEKRDSQLVFRFHESLFDHQQKTPFDTPNMNFHAMLRAVLLDVSNDLSLNSGDLMIMSNEIILHRRNECTHAFDLKTNTWESREMATLRFYL